MSSFEDKAEARAKFFQSLFRAPKGRPIHEILHVVSNFQTVFMVEFFQGFYDLMKQDILMVIRESQRYGRMLGNFNVNFQCVIPKKQDGISFKDYRPISCCNVIYMIVAKIIVRRQKPIRSEIIAKEQFGFLQNRQIHDAVSVAQEVFHSIKNLNEKASILKLDLSKAYDRVNWTSPFEWLCFRWVCPYQWLIG